jgi:hypothetical protein
LKKLEAVCYHLPQPLSILARLRNFLYSARMFCRGQKGMTVTELVVVVAIILGMALLSIPAFFFFHGKGHDRDVIEIATELQHDIERWSLEKMGNYPTILDQSPSNTVCLSCFNDVLGLKIDQNLWYKVDDMTYFFSRDEKSPNLNEFSEPGDYKLTYDSLNGKVELIQL